MRHTVTVIAPGAMGGGVGRMLVERGFEVMTVLEGRSAASVRRAGEGGLKPIPLAAAAETDAILSILPPDQAHGLAESLKPALSAARKKPLYADCNALSPETMVGIAELLADTGAPVVDASIVGSPPKPGAKGPLFYVSGPSAHRFAELFEGGLRVEVLDRPIGAASGFKMCYGGITKGFVALSSAMLLAAERSGAGDAVLAELGRSRPTLLAFMREYVPDMFPKAYRWVGEMEEIAGFMGEDDPATRDIYLGIARLYERLAADNAGSRAEIGVLARRLG